MKFKINKTFEKIVIPSILVILIVFAFYAILSASGIINAEAKIGKEVTKKQEEINTALATFYSRYRIEKDTLENLYKNYDEPGNEFLVLNFVTKEGEKSLEEISKIGKDIECNNEDIEEYFGKSKGLPYIITIAKIPEGNRFKCQVTYREDMPYDNTNVSSRDDNSFFHFYEGEEIKEERVALFLQSGIKNFLDVRLNSYFILKDEKQNLENKLLQYKYEIK